MERLTKRQAAIIGLYTGITAGGFGDIHELACELLGHPIFDMEMAQPPMKEKLRQLAKPLFLEICYREEK
jgi:hypothetical protein